MGHARRPVVSTQTTLQTGETVLTPATTSDLTFATHLRGPADLYPHCRDLTQMSFA